MAGERSSDGSGDGALFDVDTGPVPVFSCLARVAVRETELTDVPICRVGGASSRNTALDVNERIRSSRCPETETASAKVDVVSAEPDGSSDRQNKTERKGDTHKLYQVLGWSWVVHCLTPPTSQLRVLSVV